MGKGDKKTRKGKIIIGSHGKKRPKNGPRVTIKKTQEEAS
ncbi:30S ribosomal protein THX [Sphingobacterium bambusae]|uniref:30S ribosomal protein THX n=1 Tax=Sphingobacterium bambusae TaxID=662858 RepID=A0ABW6BBE5_9SPHI|nr:30S ribosomal protein THX [Sphingobacterium bambusae]WPL48263.1 30S ribosomal protein THX [Sphingobacterium bambusae]